MRVYVPLTLSDVARLLEQRALAAPLEAFAVTPAVREWYVDDDAEELEYAAFAEASRVALRLLAVRPGEPRRRVVLAADVPQASPRGGAVSRAAVTVPAPVPLADVAAVHVDDAAAEPDVAAAAHAASAADAGDEDAALVVGRAEDHELAWYATQELPALLG